ncbi:MAG: DUF3859 domain-containing protein [Pseudomonadales bacterium]|nr:DUF3859 domain-containing protein [Pseudomonadales bacterium]
MKAILFLVTAALVTSCATLTTENPISGHIIDSGVIAYKDITHVYQVGNRKASEASGLHISNSTSLIPLELGSAFGMRWEISGLSDHSEVTVRYEAHHPPMTTEAGEISTGIVEYLPHAVYDGKVSSIDGFQFSEEFELVAGIYMISISYKNVNLESHFEVGM